MIKSCLSQWYAAPFTVDGILYPTAEHWMMAAKARVFDDDEVLAQILAAPDPKAAKALGRTVRNFDSDQWRDTALEMVVEGNLAKFSQNRPLQEFLVGTGDVVLVEASPDDRIWGIGLAADDERALEPGSWRGQNLLGFALMSVRSQLRGDSCE